MVKHSAQLFMSLQRAVYRRPAVNTRVVSWRHAPRSRRAVHTGLGPTPRDLDPRLIPSDNGSSPHHQYSSLFNSSTSRALVLKKKIEILTRTLYLLYSNFKLKDHYGPIGITRKPIVYSYHNIKNFTDRLM